MTLERLVESIERPGVARVDQLETNQIVILESSDAADDQVIDTEGCKR